MPSKIETSIVINAPPEAVWAVLSDGASYPSWNPFISQLDGEFKAGQRLTMTAKPPGKSGGTFRPVLLVVEPGKELRWRGSLPIPWMFVGEHYFVLTPTPAGCRLVHGENFSGLLVPLVGGMLKATEQGFNDMNAALKRRAEQAAAGAQ